jgi:hypothetical protein
LHAESTVLLLDVWPVVASTSTTSSLDEDESEEDSKEVLVAVAFGISIVAGIDFAILFLLKT